MRYGKGAWLAAFCALCCLVISLGTLSAASPKADAPLKTDAVAKDQPVADSGATAECRNVPATPGPMPAWYAERCVKVSKGTDQATFAPDASQGPILLQEVSTNTVRKSSVAGIATLTSFGSLVPLSTTDFPADFIRLPSDPQRVYQITSSGAVSRYTTGGVNTVLAPIAPATGSTWSDTATDPTTGVVYGSAIVGSCASSTLSTLNVTGGTSTPDRSAARPRTIRVMTATEAYAIRWNSSVGTPIPEQIAALKALAGHLR